MNFQSIFFLFDIDFLQIEIIIYFYENKRWKCIALHPIIIPYQPTRFNLNRKNNFDFLRLLFSTVVLISHSFPLTGVEEPLSIMTGKQIEGGALAVNVFFIISGFLIFNSLKASRSMVNYLWKRVLRLFPALFVVLMITLPILVLVHQGSNSIFLQKDFYTYLPKNMTLYLFQFRVEGVFEDNIYPKSINGSLWTLAYEFTMYLIVFAFFAIRKQKLSLYILLLLFFICYTLYNIRPEFFSAQLWNLRLFSDQFYRMAAYFIAGSILSFVDLKRLNKSWIKIGLFAVLVLSVLLGIYKQVSLVLLPLLIMLIGISYSRVLNYIPQKIGDISYGVYIYAFLVQQTCMHYFDLGPYALTALALPVTYLLAYLSWHYVEQPALKFKDKFK